MKEFDFPYPKISRPKPCGDAQTDSSLIEVFDLLENYRARVKPFIFSDIHLTFDRNDERFLLSRIQQYLSSVLLRSLYLRNGIVDAINSRNKVSLFAILKSFIEVPAALAYLHSLLDKKGSNDEMLELFSRLVLGNKGKGELRVGHLEAVNVLRMFEKLEKFLQDIESKNKPEEVATIKGVMTEFYGVVCNASHPNHDAHLITGIFEIASDRWRGLYPDEMKARFVEESGWYKPSLVLTMEMTVAVSERIMLHESVKSFKILDNHLYFDE